MKLNLLFHYIHISIELQKYSQSVNHKIISTPQISGGGELNENISGGEPKCKPWYFVISSMIRITSKATAQTESTLLSFHQSNFVRQISRRMMKCIVLYCTTLYCAVYYYTVLYLTVLYCIVQ